MKNRFADKLHSFIEYFSYCFIMFTLILFVFSFIRGNTKGEAYVGSFGSEPFNDGWTMEAGGEVTQVSLPVNSGAGSGEWVVIRNTLPEDLSGDSTILFRTRLEDIHIYVDGELRSEYASENIDSVGYYLPSAYVACDLTSEDAGKEIAAYILVKNRGAIESVSIGPGNNAWYDVVSHNIILLIVAVMIFIIGLGVILFYLFSSDRFRIDKSFFFMGMFMCSMSMWMLSESKLRQIILAKPSLSNYFAYYSIEITGVFVCCYFDEIQSRVYHRLYLILETLITGQILINVLLNSIGVMEYFQTVFISHFWLALGILAVIGTLIRDILQKRIREYIAIFVGTCLFLGCCLMEILRFFFSDAWSFGVFVCAGVIALLVTTIIQTALRTEKNNYAREHQKEESLMNTIEAITGAIDAKDEYTGGHSDRVGNYAGMIAREMAADYDFSEEDILRIRYIGFMHDIGKIGVADSVLNKAGKLSEEEFTLMKKHAEIGYDLLRSMENSIEGLLDGIRHHHERFDGKGYPDGLEGTDIPLVARIICVADCYDAMTSNRVYRRRLSDPEVIDEIKRCSGSQFDPAIAEIFVRMIERGDFKAVTIDGMEASELGSIYKSSELERKLQNDISADGERVFNPAHVRMICYILKLAEKNRRPFDVFFAGAEKGDFGREYYDHIRGCLTGRDVLIEYDAASAIVVLFDRDDAGMKQVRESICAPVNGSRTVITELG